MKRLLFLLSGNISTTPRALKSIELAIRQGYTVDLCLVNRLDKWKWLDNDIISSLPCTANYIPFRKEEGVWVWLFVGLLQKLSVCISKCITNNLMIKAFASSKINILYYLKLQRLKDKYDMVLGYSGMYYPAFIFSQKHSIPFSFDMEDYHPGEVIYHTNKNEEANRRIAMFKQILPLASYISYGSPLIEEKAVNLLMQNRIEPPKGFTINNTFRHRDFALTPCHDDKIKFVWFSQTISYGRGLDLILPVLNKYMEHLSLTLIGNIDDNFYTDVLFKYKDILLIKEAMPQDELHKEIGKYDIGLAIEQNVDENRSICLTNKIFTYLLSGLYVVATSTKAQKQLMLKYPAHGVVVDSTIEDMDKCIREIINDIWTIRNEKEMRFREISSISWESEEKQLLNAWTKILD